MNIPITCTIFYYSSKLLVKTIVPNTLAPLFLYQIAANVLLRITHNAIVNTRNATSSSNVEIEL